MKHDGKKKILIIDDDEINSKALSKRLERRGYDVIYISDPGMVLSTLNTEKIDLVILDIVMPLRDGIAVLKDIRENFSSEELPVIMVTVIADGEEIFSAFAAGANDYITKPVNIDVAASRIRGQLSAVDLVREKIRKKEIEAINAIIITYHHQINNPLAIAKCELELMRKTCKDSEQLQISVVLNSLERINNLLKNIKELANSKVISFSPYVSGSKMLNTKGSNN